MFIRSVYLASRLQHQRRRLRRNFKKQLQQTIAVDCCWRKIKRNKDAVKETSNNRVRGGMRRRCDCKHYQFTPTSLTAAATASEATNSNGTTVVCLYNLSLWLLLQEGSLLLHALYRILYQTSNQRKPERQGSGDIHATNAMLAIRKALVECVLAAVRRQQALSVQPKKKQEILELRQARGSMRH